MFVGNNWKIRALAAVAASCTVSGVANAATFADGYTLGSGLLGTDLIFDNAQNAGLAGFDARANDTGNGAGAYGWVATWEELWDIGTAVEITGIALPLRAPNTGTANNTANGTFTFDFYELTGGVAADAWDGTDNGESILASRDVEFVTAGTNAAQVVWAQFDTPITYTSGSTGVAISVDSTSSIRTRFDAVVDTADGQLQGRANGLQNSTQGVQWTLAGSPIFIPPDPPISSYRVDAALDQPEDSRWDTAVPAFEAFAFEAGATPSPVSVSDPSVPGITAAYDVGAIGTPNAYDPQAGGTEQMSRRDASFEVWFKPDSLAGGDQIIFEVGGAGNGTYFGLQDDTLTLFSNGQIDNTSASTTLTDTDWTQVVGVIHNTFSSALPSVDDFVELYVNGVLVDESSGALVDLNDWAGGNEAGIGQDGQTIASDGPIDNTGDDNTTTSFDFAGLIASLEYVDGALTAQEVLDRYLAITSASSLDGDYSGDGFVSQSDLDLVLLNWGNTAAPAGFDEGNLPGGGPFDGLMSQNELDGVLLNWGDGTPPSVSAIPEPTSAAMLAAAGALLLRRRIS